MNALGRRLRRGATVDPGDLDKFQQLNSEHLRVMLVAQEVLRSRVRGLRPTSRLKTLQTIVDKLRREPTMALGRMRDIAGLRIVEEMTRQEQAVLASEVKDVLGELGSVKVIDRLRHPSHGYRAIHLELCVDGRFVEVQVRTRRQDQWAQIVERLGDSWGRQIRYGGQPAEPQKAIGASSRGELWAIVVDLARWIEEFELAEIQDDASEIGGSLNEVRSAVDRVLDSVQRVAESGSL